MEFDFLTPIDPTIIAFAKKLGNQQLGTIIKKYEYNNFPDLKDVQIAFFGVLEYRNSSHELVMTKSLDKVRKSTYSLYSGNWNIKIADIGDIKVGANIADTYFALREIMTELLKKNIKIICLGGSQDLTYPIYRCFDNLDQMVNLVAVDNKFDLGNVDEAISDKNYLSKIIIDEPNNLNNYSNIGFQTYYNAQDEINLIQKLHYDAYRLGEITSKTELCEPILRNADFLSIDLSALKSTERDDKIKFEPNGFDGKELCAIGRYAGISDTLSVCGIFDLNGTTQEANLVSQLIWYFLEGVNLREIEHPNLQDDVFLKYMVTADDQEITFFKSTKTQRWWILVPIFYNGNNKTSKESLLPCTHDDYLNCCQEQIPERWWKAQQKSVV